MKAGAPAAPRDIACEMTAATPGPGVATARKYATQKVASPYHDISTPVGSESTLLDALPMQGDVEPLALLFLGDAQSERLVDGDQDHVADREPIHHRREDALELREDLMTDGRVDAGQLLAEEHAGQQSAENSADTVDAEGIEGVVVAKRMLERSGRKIANHARRGADDARTGRADVPRRGSDGHQSRHRTRGDTENARLTLGDPFGEHPAERRRPGRQLRGQHGHTRAPIA